MNLWQSLTDLGDAAFLASFAVGITVWLATLPGIRLAALWVVAFGTAICIVGATKLAFMGWGIGIRALDFTGISGHSTLAGAIFPILAALATRTSRRSVRLFALALAGVLCVAIGISRVVLGAHSPSEVVLGLALGFTVATLVVRSAERVAAGRYRWFAPLITLVLLAVSSVSYGERAHSQHVLVKIALALSGREHPFTRATWRIQTEPPGSASARHTGETLSSGSSPPPRWPMSAQ